MLPPDARSATSNTGKPSRLVIQTREHFLGAKHGSQHSRAVFFDAFGRALTVAVRAPATLPPHANRDDGQRKAGILGERAERVAPVISFSDSRRSRNACPT
jgi:hypothetical protein